MKRRACPSSNRPRATCAAAVRPWAALQTEEPASTDVLAEKVAATADLAAAFPFNPNKASEYDPQAALAPPAGAFVKPQDPIVGASTVSEANGSDKVGSGGAADRREPDGRDRSIASASIRPAAR